MSSERRPPEWYDANPHARWSFSRWSTWRRCPAWFRFQYLEWHRTPQPAVSAVGAAVEATLEAVFDGRPAAGVGIEELPERAAKRLDAVFDREWARARAAHEANPNGLLPFDLDPERYRAYVHRGLTWHLDEVRARMEAKHPRTGALLPQLEACDTATAWNEVRPWHPDRNASFDESMERIPEGWFQGQVDLAYTWTGGKRIVDLKASDGGSPFAVDVPRQLGLYAWMEERMGRAAPEGLEVWFLGREEPTLLPIPEAGSFAGFEAEMGELIAQSGSESDAFGAWRAEDFPAEPAVLESHAAEEGDASAWCRLCPAAPTCPRSAAEGAASGEGVAFDDLPAQGPITLEGLVVGIGEPRERRGRSATRRFTLQNGTGSLSLSWDAGLLELLIADGLRAGRTVRLSGCRPWKHPKSGNILIYDGGADMRLDILEGGGGAEIAPQPGDSE